MGFLRASPTTRHSCRCVALLLVQLLLAAPVRAQAEPQVATSGDTLVYRGDLTAAGLQRLQTHYAATAGATRWLEIDSGGGEVNVAMDFGEWVFAAALAVRVSNRCLSACANYVFPAAVVKVIAPGAVVAWHGSAIQGAAASRAAIDAVIERDVLPDTAPREREATRAPRRRDARLSHPRRSASDRFFPSSRG